MVQILQEKVQIFHEVQRQRLLWYTMFCRFCWRTERMLRRRCGVDVVGLCDEFCRCSTNSHTLARLRVVAAGVLLLLAIIVLINACTRP